MNIVSQQKDLFATRIWSYDLSVLRQYHAEWIDYFLALRAENPGMERRSVRSGWKTPYQPFDRYPPLAPLAQVARACFDHAFKDLAFEVPPHRSPYGLEAAINLTDPGGYNVQHGHEGTFLAASYYLKVPENGGDITFMDPRPAARYSPGDARNSLGSSHTTVAAKEATLLVFPGWLEHRVEENQSGEPRMAVVINAL